VARIHRPRYLLDSRHLAIHLCRNPGRHRVGLSHSFHHLRPRVALRKTSVRMWASRAAGRVHHGVGRPLHDYFGAVDDWWHRAYGLDVKILSPPHACSPSASRRACRRAGVDPGLHERAHSDLRCRYLKLFLYVGGVMLVALTAFQWS